MKDRVSLLRPTHASPKGVGCPHPAGSGIANTFVSNNVSVIDPSQGSLNGTATASQLMSDALAVETVLLVLGFGRSTDSDMPI